MAELLLCQGVQGATTLGSIVYGVSANKCGVGYSAADCIVDNFNPQASCSAYSCPDCPPSVCPVFPSCPSADTVYVSSGAAFDWQLAASGFRDSQDVFLMIFACYVLVKLLRMVNK